MNAGKAVLAQIMDFVFKYEFSKSVEQYNGNYKVKTFNCWEQFIIMSFAQLTFRESLRDIESCLHAISHKLYHCGVKSKIAKSTLADANESRDWRIYADFVQKLIIEARRLYIRRTMISMLTLRRLPTLWIVPRLICVCHYFPGQNA